VQPSSGSPPRRAEQIRTPSRSAPSFMPVEPWPSPWSSDLPSGCSVRPGHTRPRVSARPVPEQQQRGNLGLDPGAPRLGPRGPARVPARVFKGSRWTAWGVYRARPGRHRDLLLRHCGAQRGPGSPDAPVETADQCPVLGFREDACCARLVGDGRRKGGLRLRAGRSGPAGAGTRTRARTRAIKGAANVPGRRPLSHACSADRRSHGNGAVEVPGICGAVEAGDV
jgi:hypothetical protein